MWRNCTLSYLFPCLPSNVSLCTSTHYCFQVGEIYRMWQLHTELCKLTRPETIQVNITIMKKKKTIWLGHFYQAICTRMKVKIVLPQVDMVVCLHTKFLLEELQRWHYSKQVQYTTVNILQSYSKMPWYCSTAKTDMHIKMNLRLICILLAN